MARKDPRPEVSRRKFLAGVAVAGAATTVAAPPDAANAATPPVAAAKIPSALRPTAQQIAARDRDPEGCLAARRPRRLRLHGGRDPLDRHRIHLRQSGLELPRHPRIADQLRRQHASRNSSSACTRNPRSRWRTATSRPPASWPPSCCHGTVGLMHGTMSIYNAWCDRAPVMVMGGNDLDASKRPPGVPTTHSAQDINAIVRDFTKWDDTPVSLQHFAQSFVRACQVRDDAAARAGHAHARRRGAGIADQGARAQYALHSEIRAGRAAAGRGRGAARGRQAPGQCRRTR